MDTILTIKRQTYTDNSTIGQFFIGMDKQCYTLERPVRKTKIDGETAIPCGRYELSLYYSNHQKMQVPLLMNVPDFSYVEIHPGNFPTDSEGCLLLGKIYDPTKPDQILESRQAFKDLMSAIEPALKNGKIYLEVLA